MTITLYELAAKDKSIRFSPFCWRTRMSLVHKGLDFDSVPWSFTDKTSTAEPGYDKVPVIKDGKRWVGDSWDIAKYLDENYPDSPMLMANEKEEALANKVMDMINENIFSVVLPIAVLQVHNILDSEGQKYFREGREKMLGNTLEAINVEPEVGVENLAKALTMFEPMLETDYLESDHPTYADFALFGILKWLDVVSSYAPFSLDTRVGKWFLRVSKLYGAHAEQAPKVRS